MTSVTCPHCGHVQVLWKRTVERIKRLGKRRLRCAKCGGYFFAYVSQPKTP